MAAGLLVLVPFVLLLLLVVALVAGLVAWAVLRPADGEPPARARLRRATGTTAATATAAAVPLLLGGALLALGAPELAAVVVVLAGLLHVGVLWCGEALTARPHAARRTALLAPGPPARTRTALVAVLAGSQAGLLVLLALALLDAPLGPLPAPPPNVTLLLGVPAVLLGALVVLAVRQVRRRSSDARLHPEVDAAGRARATHRLLRAGSAAGCAALGLALAAPQVPSAGTAADPPASAALVLGGVLVAVAAVVSLLPVPALPLRPEHGLDAVLGQGAGTGAP